MKITQAYLNKLTTDILGKDGWELLYEDLPGGTRSGIGITSKLNSIWEQTYNMIPDLLYIKDSELLLGEVDAVLNEEYREKFRKYHQLDQELVEKISEVLEVKINKISYLFISKKDNPDPPPLGCIFIDFEREKMIENFLLFEN